MKSKCIKLTLLTDVVITANSATQGEHEALDFIPGSLLRGAVINNLGGDFQPELFFSGKIRFQNAYPMTNDDHFTLPIPFSYHNIKGKKDKIYNAAFVREAGQPEQLRGNYMYGNKKVEVKTTYHMKTSISREKGYTAEDSQLFGYESIKAGTTFGCYVDFDDEISDEIVEKITKSIISDNIHLGKSRSAEYGLVKAELINNVSDYKQALPEEKDTTILYCASDLYLEENNIPVTMLKPEHFGLDSNCKIDWEHSFVRTRKYSPWNAFWKGRMRERQVIRHGSVIKIVGNIDISTLEQRFKKNYGLFREEGLGRILVNPDFVWKKVPELKEEKSSFSDTYISSLFETASSDNSLKAILKNKADNNNNNLKAKEIGIKWSKVWYDFWYKKYEGENLPSKAQWGQVRDICSSYHTKGLTLIEALENYCARGVCNAEWNNHNTEYKENDQRYTLYAYMKQQLEKINNEELAAAILLNASKEISSKIK